MDTYIDYEKFGRKFRIPSDSPQWALDYLGEKIEIIQPKSEFNDDLGDGWGQILFNLSMIEWVKESPYVLVDWITHWTGTRWTLRCLFATGVHRHIIPKWIIWYKDRKWIGLFI